jgi:hypothetical protein
MKRAGYLADKPGFSLLLFLLCLVLFSWPLLSAIQSYGAEPIFHYLMAVWGVIILILFLSRRSRDCIASTGKDGAHEEVEDV